MDAAMNDIYERGIAALREKLGIVGMIRFLQLLSPGRGNWAEERHAWQDSLEPGEFTRAVKARSARTVVPKKASASKRRPLRPRSRAKVKA